MRRETRRWFESLPAGLSVHERRRAVPAETGHGEPPFPAQHKAYIDIANHQLYLAKGELLIHP